MSSISMANTSADSRTSSRVMMIGGRSFSSWLHQVRTPVNAGKMLGFMCRSTTITFTSEYCSWKSSLAAEPYSTIETRSSPHAQWIRLTRSCNLSSGFFTMLRSMQPDYQLPPAPPPPLMPPPNPQKPPPPPPPHPPELPPNPPPQLLPPRPIALPNRSHGSALPIPPPLPGPRPLPRPARESARMMRKIPPMIRNGSHHGASLVGGLAAR